MSTVSVVNLKHPSSASNNIVLDASGNATFAGTAAMASSFLRNRLINGGFDVWQRGTSTSTNGAYLADRWIVATGTTVTGSQSSDVPSGFRFSLSLTGTNFPQTLQRIESVNCFDLVGQTVSVSFWAKQTSGAASNSLAVQLATANSLDNFSAVTAYSFQLFTGTNSWVRYTATFSNLPAATANGLQVLIYANTAGSATFLVTGVQLEVGTAATPFERRQFGQELALCQRYYQAGNFTLYGPGGQTSGLAGQWLPWPVVMRASPTVAMVSPSYSNASGLNAFNANTGGFSPAFTVTGSNASVSSGYTSAAEI